MSEPSTILPEALRAELKEIMREVLREERTENTTAARAEKDTLLTPEQAAAAMGVSRRWVYRHAAKLPFTRRISRKNLRFSEAALCRWMAGKKPGSR
jgi:excisionase family DNA binding protein